MTRQIYSYSAGLNCGTLFAAVASNHVGQVLRDDTAQAIYIDFLADETSTEQSNVQAIATGAPYNLTFVSQVSTVSAQQWDPRSFGSALMAWLDAGHLPHMWVECGPSVAQQTQVASPGDAVGCIQESGFLANQWFAPNSTHTPTWNTFGAPECHLVFSSASAGTYLAASASQNAFAFMHNTGVFAIAFAVQVAVDGTQIDLLDSSSGTGTNYGIFVTRTSSNTVFVRVVANFGVSTFIWSGASTQTLKVADGMVLVSLSANGMGNLTIAIGSKTPDNIAQSHAPPNASSAVAMTSPLTVGRQNATTGFPFQGSLRFMVILNRPFTATDLTQLTNYMGLVRQSNNILFQLYGTGLLMPCFHYHDFTVPQLPGGGGMWQNTSRTTPVANANDPVAVIDHALDPTNAWGRALVQGASANQAVYDPGAAVPGILFNGTATPNNSNYPVAGPTWAGMWTLIIIAMNRDQTNGSHIMISSAQYPVTGNNYASNPGPNMPYTVFHMGGVETGPGTILLPALNPQMFLFELARQGNNFRQRVSTENATEVSGPAVGGASTYYSPVNIGNQVIAGWEMDGIQAMMMAWPVVLTRAQVDSLIIPAMKSKFPGLIFY